MPHHSRRLISLLFALLSLTLPAKYTLSTDGLRSRILRDSKPFIESITSRVLAQGDFTPDAQHSVSYVAQPRGMQWTEVWSENPASLFRQEVVVHGGLEQVEISFLASNGADALCDRKSIELVLPYALFAGAEYEGYATNGRSVDRVKGTIAADAPDGPVCRKFLRFLAVKKAGMEIIFDFNPLGPGDYFSCWRQGAIRALWEVTRAGDKLIMRMQTSVSNSFTGTKLVIRDGVFADYARLHSYKAFHYTSALAAGHQFSFGATKTGPNYTHADRAPFDTAKGFGWLDASGLDATTHSPEGAYYSHVAGRDRTFRITGLPPGLHIVTVGTGNFGDAANAFQVLLNGAPMTTHPETAGTREALILTQALWIENGTLDIQLKGDFLLSTLSTQFLLATAEDFSVRRAFWVWRGFEPYIAYRNSTWKRAPDTFPCDLQRIPLPVPGQEAAATLRATPAPVELPDPAAPETAWRIQANLVQCGGYTRPDPADAARRQKRLSHLKSIGVNAVMTGGLLSRHTYPEAITPETTAHYGDFVRIAHENGIKVIDHLDATLLWNNDSGFRLIAERIGQTERDRTTGLPNPRLCLANPDFHRAFLEYCKELVRLGVDGFQIDEAHFFARGCVCAECRRQFHADTGWHLPMNELDPSWKNPSAPISKAWFTWKRARVANWFVATRRELQKLKPNLSFSQYTTHWGFTTSLPRGNSCHDLEELARAVDIFGTEVMTRNPLASARALVPYRKAFNLLHFAYGTPIWGIFYNNHPDVRSFVFALSNMNGQNALLSHLPVPKGKQDFQPFAGSPDNMDRRNAAEEAEIALLFSRASRDWNSGVGFEPELFGLAQTLEEMHVPYLVIGETSLKPDLLKRFKVLSIGSSGALSDAQAAVIKDFARQGGTVLLANIAGTFDEVGNRRAKWAFADVFGFDTRVTPARDIRQLVAKDGRKLTLKTPVTYYEPKPLCRADSAWKARVGKELLPVWIERKVGKGRMIYNPIQMAGSLYAREGSVGRKWGFERDDALAALLHEELGRQLADARLWSTDAPEKVYTTIYAEPRRLLVHFLNGTGATYLGKNEVMTDAVPAVAFPKIARDITFTIPRPRLPVRQAYAISPDFQGRQPVPFTIAKDGAVTATLPASLFSIYTIVVLEK